VAMLEDFIRSIHDLLSVKEVTRLRYYRGHSMSSRVATEKNGTLRIRKSRYNHSLRVAYLSYTIAGILRQDRAKAARAGLLHDCGLHPGSKESTTTQMLKHSLRSALIARNIGEDEQVVRAINSHMFPLNLRFSPSSWLSFIVWLADKIDGVFEFISLSTVLDKVLN
jgi:putative nucleotidyltransferase with HDIG domain